MVLRAESLYQEIYFLHETARVDGFLACLLTGSQSFWSLPWGHALIGRGQSLHWVAWWWHVTCLLRLCHRGWGWTSPAVTLVLHSLPSPRSPHSDNKNKRRLQWTVPSTLPVLTRLLLTTSLRGQGCYHPIFVVCCSVPVVPDSL